MPHTPIRHVEALLQAVECETEGLLCVRHARRPSSDGPRHTVRRASRPRGHVRREAQTITTGANGDPAGFCTSLGQPSSGRDHSRELREILQLDKSREMSWSCLSFDGCTRRETSVVSRWLSHEGIPPPRQPPCWAQSPSTTPSTDQAHRNQGRAITGPTCLFRAREGGGALGAFPPGTIPVRFVRDSGCARCRWTPQAARVFLSQSNAPILSRTPERDDGRVRRHLCLHGITAAAGLCR